MPNSSFHLWVFGNLCGLECLEEGALFWIQQWWVGEWVCECVPVPPPCCLRRVAALTASGRRRDGDSRAAEPRSASEHLLDPELSPLPLFSQPTQIPEDPKKKADVIQPAASPRYRLRTGAEPWGNPGFALGIRAQARYIGLGGSRR